MNSEGEAEGQIKDPVQCWKSVEMVCEVVGMSMCAAGRAGHSPPVRGSVTPGSREFTPWDALGTAIP